VCITEQPSRHLKASEQCNHDHFLFAGYQGEAPGLFTRVQRYINTGASPPGTHREEGRDDDVLAASLSSFLLVRPSHPPSRSRLPNNCNPTAVWGEHNCTMRPE
jgi:hypothetical protein